MQARDVPGDSHVDLHLLTKDHSKSFMTLAMPRYVILEDGTFIFSLRVYDRLAPSVFETQMKMGARAEETIIRDNVSKIIYICPRNSESNPFLISPSLAQ